MHCFLGFRLWIEDFLADSFCLININEYFLNIYHKQEILALILKV
jgi:hypothetical protein